MARTIAEIKADLTANFMANPTMQAKYGFAPGTAFEDEFSQVSFESVLFYIIAVFSWTIDKNQDALKAHVDAKVAENQRWNLAAIERDAKAYQHGDTLIWMGTHYGYAVENSALKIVKLASASESGETVILKVAKEVSGVITPLTSPELTAFQLYMKGFIAPGVDAQVVSRPADDLKVYYNIYFNPLIMNPDGSLISNPSVFPVEDAINEYLKGLEFGRGVFSVVELTDRIQAVAGVIAPVFQSAAAKYGLQPYSSITNFYNMNAGHGAIDSAFPLSTTLTYTLP